MLATSIVRLACVTNALALRSENASSDVTNNPSNGSSSSSPQGRMTFNLQSAKCRDTSVLRAHAAKHEKQHIASIQGASDASAKGEVIQMDSMATAIEHCNASDAFQGTIYNKVFSLPNEVLNVVDTYLGPYIGARVVSGEGLEGVITHMPSVVSRYRFKQDLNWDLVLAERDVKLHGTWDETPPPIDEWRQICTTQDFFSLGLTFEMYEEIDQEWVILKSIDGQKGVCHFCRVKRDWIDPLKQDFFTVKVEPPEGIELFEMDTRYGPLGTIGDYRYGPWLALAVPVQSLDSDSSGAVRYAGRDRHPIEIGVDPQTRLDKAKMIGMEQVVLQYALQPFTLNGKHGVFVGGMDGGHDRKPIRAIYIQCQMNADGKLELDPIVHGLVVANWKDGDVFDRLTIGHEHPDLSVNLCLKHMLSEEAFNVLLKIQAIREEHHHYGRSANQEVDENPPTPWANVPQETQERYKSLNRKFAELLGLPATFFPLNWE